MGYNNWSVASKVREESVWKELPVVGRLPFDVYTKQVVIFGAGAVLGFSTKFVFPKNQWPSWLIAALATIALAIYMAWMPSTKKWPEKTNFDIFMSHTTKLHRKRYFTPLSTELLDDATKQRQQRNRNDKKRRQR